MVSMQKSMHGISALTYSNWRYLGRFRYPVHPDQYYPSRDTGRPVLPNTPTLPIPRTNMYQNTWKKLPSSGFVPLMDIKKRFGLAVKERRGALGISQEELAMRIGTDQAYVSRLKRAG